MRTLSLSSLLLASGLAIHMRAAHSGGFVDVVNVKDYGAVGDWNLWAHRGTDDTKAVAAARSAALSSGRALYFPAGIYGVDSRALDYGPIRSADVKIVLRGDGEAQSMIVARIPGQTILHIRTDGPFWNGIEISHLRLEGYSSSDVSTAHGIYLADTTESGPSHIFLHDLRIDGFSGHGVFLPREWHTLIQDVSVNDCGDNLFELGGGNTTVLIRTYAQTVRTGKAGYRIHGGNVTMIGCNGIDNGWETDGQKQADWGVFGSEVYEPWAPRHKYSMGQIVSQSGQEYEVIAAGASGPSGGPGPTISADIRDGTVRWRHIGAADTALGYFRGTVIGANIEDFTRHGIRLKGGSSVNLLSSTFLAPSGGDGYIPLWVEYADQASYPGALDGLTSFGTKGGKFDGSAAIHETVDGGGFFRIGGTGNERPVYVRTRGATLRVPGFTVQGNGYDRNAITTQRFQVKDGPLTLTRVEVGYSASMTPDADLGNEFVITVTDGKEFGINSPSGHAAAGMRMTIRIRNASRGVLGAVRWADTYKMAAWMQPSQGHSRAIDLQYDGTNWVEVSRTPADVPN
jgi:hypothetical protein